MATKKAFTLIEIMVTFVIISVLILLGLFGASILQKNARDKQRIVVAAELVNQIDKYTKIKLSYPQKVNVEFNQTTFRIDNRTYYTFSGVTQPASTTSSNGTRYYYNKSSNGFILCVLLESDEIKSFGTDECPPTSNWN